MNKYAGKIRLGVIAIFCAVALAIVGLHRSSGRAYSQPPTPPLFVTDRCTGAVTAYPAGSNGDVSPLAPAPTGLAEPELVAIDASGNIYAFNVCNNTITVYAKGSNGDAAPTAIIGGSNTGLTGANSIAVDSSGNIYVLDGDSVLVYAAGSNGNVAPIATISGSNTGFISPSSIALDSSGNIYVADWGDFIGEGPGSVFVYSALGSSTGLLNVAPIATISGFNTGLVSPVGIAVDSSRNIYVADDGMRYSIIFPPSVYVFSAGSYGDIAPIATISGSNTGVTYPAGIALDSSRKIYVANSYPGGLTVYPALGSSTGLLNEFPTATINAGNNDISYFALDSSGNIYWADVYTNSLFVYPALGSSTGTVNESPIATISTAMTTGLTSPGGIAVDSSGKIYVPGYNVNVASVFVYPAGSNCNAAPIGAISGPDTLLETPAFVAVDSSGQIYVADDDRVLVYPAGSTGNVAPIATISGPDLYGGSFAVDSSGNIYMPDPSSSPPAWSSIRRGAPAPPPLSSSGLTPAWKTPPAPRWIPAATSMCWTWAPRACLSIRRWEATPGGSTSSPPPPSAGLRACSTRAASRWIPATTSMWRATTSATSPACLPIRRWEAAPGFSTRSPPPPSAVH
ncbi:NHL repeat-containing protein [Candidatus Binatus sp.]|jgi:sugar lactone lactonase YvrE|uniref:NHL repeat-containing protein n=1 Tax=Candidatus Binatus sp. TaxID=2811406 RepID=UPI003BD64EF9